VIIFVCINCFFSSYHAIDEMGEFLDQNLSNNPDIRNSDVIVSKNIGSASKL
jgi:hypothetical protein